MTGPRSSCSQPQGGASSCLRPPAHATARGRAQPVTPILQTSPLCQSRSLAARLQPIPVAVPTAPVHHPWLHALGSRSPSPSPPWPWGAALPASSCPRYNRQLGSGSTRLRGRWVRGGGQAAGLGGGETNAPFISLTLPVLIACSG